MSKIIISHPEYGTDILNVETTFIEELKKYINNNSVLSSNLKYLIESGNENLFAYIIGLTANGYATYCLPNVEEVQKGKYILVREGIAIKDEQPVRGLYKYLGTISDESPYEDLVSTLQKMTDSVSIANFTSHLKSWDLVDLAVITAIPEVKAVMEITNTKVVFN